jgi:hypothetical protein
MAFKPPSAKNNSSSQPQTNAPVTTSQPGKTAQQAAIPQSTLPNDLKNIIPGMFKEQSLKANNSSLRFRMEVPGGSTFSAHLDPNDVSRQQMKRFAQLDALSGVVIQNFGYKPEMLEIKGTTGSRYYEAIKGMDDVYNSQNNGKPLPVNLYLEGINYTGFWSSFTFNRTINSQAGNLVQYSMQFIVFTRSSDSTSGDSIAQGASIVAKNTANQKSQFTNGKAKTTQFQYTGLTINHYINSHPELIVVKDNALNFIEQHWADVPTNGAYPGPNKALTSVQRIVVPSPWSNYLNTFVVNGN